MVRLTMLLLLVSLVAFATFAFAGSVVHGELMSTSGDENRPMHVSAYSREGSLVESVPVTPDGKFYIHDLPDGVFVLSVVGSRSWTFPPMHIHLNQGQVVSKELRIDPLQIPGIAVDSASSSESDPLVLDTFGKADYFQEKEGWSVSAILGNKFMLFQAVALIFVIMFPRYLKTLDKETLAELTGEVEPDTGDPNEIVKALAGLEDVDIENEIVPAVPLSSM